MKHAGTMLLSIGVLVATMLTCCSGSGEREQGSNSRAEFAAEGLRHLSGRVLLPPGAPPDEQVVVVVSARHTYHGQEYRCELARDGSFRFDLALDVSDVRFELDARYSWLPEQPAMELPLDAPVVLRPRLGGRLRLEFEGLATERAGDETLWREAFLLVRSTLPTRETGLRRLELCDGAALEFDALSVAASHDLRLFGFEFVDVARYGLRVEAGRTRCVKLELRGGACFEGSITNREGRGILEVHVMAERETDEGIWVDVAHASSDRRGHYSIRGVPAGVMRLSFSHSRYPSQVLGPMMAIEGELQRATNVSL